MKSTVSILFLLTCCCTVISISCSCIDLNGGLIDFYFVYKIPRLETSHGIIRSGEAYVYLTSSDTNKWKFANGSIGSSESILALTLKPLFEKKRSNISYLLYNDQPPDNDKKYSKGASAHAKGIFAVFDKSGFFLSHSVPRFLNLSKNKYEYPENGHANGQTLICISFSVKNADTINKIGYHLLTMKPNIYKSRISSSFATKYPVFKDLISKKYKVPRNLTLVNDIASARGTKFILFSKNGKFEYDIYSKLLAPHFREDLLTQTWQNGAGGKLDSDCKDEFKVMNIEHIGVNKIDWKTSEDHAKWAVSATIRKNSDTVICIGDLNRMKSQFKRGGGLICLKSSNIWSNFNTTIEEIEGCKLKRPRKIIW